MHKRIIWTLFFAAFILDYFRSHSTSESPKPSSKNYKEEVFNENEINSPKEKKKVDFNDEELQDTNDYEDNYSEREKINQKRRKKNQNIDLRIEFCQSWSHRGYFNQVKEHLEKVYSNISVTPSDYPLSPTRKLLYYLVTFFQVSLILVLFAGRYVKPYLIMIIPENIIDWIDGNKMMVGIGGFLIGNVLNNNITNSGAFEIYCNEKLVWSAINNEKKVPTIEGIINIIERFGGKLYKY